MESIWRQFLINWWSPSRQLAAFWLSIIIGIVIARYFQLPNHILVWVGILWGVVYLSGQASKIELFSLAIAGICGGALLWNLTSGESWLHLGIITTVADKLTIFRDLLVDKVLLALPEPHGSLMSGILLGNRIKLDNELVEEFRRVGLSHIIAVSGYNLTVLTANIRSAFKPVFGRQVFWLALIVIASFVIITGAPSSILRAGLMVGLLLYGEYLGRPKNSLLILLTAAGVLAIFEPKIIFDVGFQLSVAATYGLLRLSPLIAEGFEKTKLPKPVTNIVSESLAAIIMTTPIIILVFERFSTVAPITNLLVVPLIPLLMAIGLIGSILVFLIPFIGSWLLFLGWPILTWILFVSEYFSKLSFATYEHALPGWILATTLVLLVGITEYFTSRRVQ